MFLIKQFIKRNFSSLLYSYQKSTARREEMEKWVQQFQNKTVPNLSDVSYDVFTYHGEDGILFYLINHLKDVPKTFVDIGAGDCIKSNCANFAMHFGWSGVFIDMSKEQLSVGKSFYRKKIRQGAAIGFTEAEVTADNVNQLIAENGSDNKIGLLSIDIDGNDYWVWKAIETVQPAIVLIEAKVEFGYKSIVVPFSRDNHHSVDGRYNGASVEALRKLGASKGYKLVGANKQGYNLFFVKQTTDLPEATVSSILGNPETVGSFYPESFFETHKFEVI
jgi:hypothetical protein